MGVDCKVSLPANVSFRNVLSVLGVLLGCKATKEPLGRDSWHAHVQGAEARSCDVTGLVNFVISIDGECVMHHPFHFEFDSSGRRGMMFGSSPERIALCRALAKFFGGSVDYNDCDNREKDYVVKAKSNAENNPEDGKPWYALQERILKLKPLSKKDIDACREYAAYK
jgi:hypothetical protein